MVDVLEADSQLSAHPQGLLFLGHGCGWVPGELQGSRLGRVCGMGSGAVIAGSVEEVDTIDLGPTYNTQGIIQIAQKVGLLTPALQHRHSSSVSHKHPHI